MTAIQETRQLINDQSSKAADQWKTIMFRDNWAACYLYYRTGELAVFAGETTPDGWTLGDQRRLGPELTRDQARARIIESCKRLPFLP